MSPDVWTVRSDSTTCQFSHPPAPRINPPRGSTQRPKPSHPEETRPTTTPNTPRLLPDPPLEVLLVRHLGGVHQPRAQARARRVERHDGRHRRDDVCAPEALAHDVGRVVLDGAERDAALGFAGAGLDEGVEYGRDDAASGAPRGRPEG